MAERTKLAEAAEKLEHAAGEAAKEASGEVVSAEAHERAAAAWRSVGEAALAEARRAGMNEKDIRAVLKAFATKVREHMGEEGEYIWPPQYIVDRLATEATREALALPAGCAITTPTEWNDMIDRAESAEARATEAEKALEEARKETWDLGTKYDEAREDNDRARALGHQEGFDAAREAFAKRLNEAVADERAAVIAWLCQPVDRYEVSPETEYALRNAAQEIEFGYHRTGRPT